MALKTAWTESEDALLRQLVEEKGPKNWGLIAAQIKTKSGKQCRRRWTNFLNADLKTGGWTPQEDNILMEGHKMHGNKWTEIAKMVGGRTDNAVKNR
ncbi:transcription factor Myb12 [Volvox carteri f. nagariensis]|uniref:Transcription factor Myb12 n=1 Tax=Volvox carteri f. nagariensis TaxID=3068 RepID=D8TT75_VOLCA|nr:transcription factor Myb12 [Volvox carteri f. nagariensis]EFJ49147.1 transcription factor Myb12 [Volvox carteri f. nagariensis]|eukprot:XP_002949595.1 transcription factor Myb12 [Volvox carteri f. nagariensis]